MTAVLAFLRRPAVLVVVGVVVSAAALWLVLRGVDVGRVASILGAADGRPLLVALGVIVVQALVRATRWRLLLPRRADGSRVPVLASLGAMLVGYLGNAVMPARLGEVVRATLIGRREGIGAPEAVGSVVLERILDVLVLAALGATAATLVAAPGWMGTAALTGLLIAIGALVAAGVVGFVAHRGASVRAPASVARIEPVARLVGRVAAGARIADRPVAIGAAALLTIVAWLLDATVFWLVARSLGLELAPVAAVLVSAMAVLSTAVPTAPGYIGTFELAAVAAAGVAGIVGDAAVAFAVLAHVTAVVPLSLAGAAALWLIGGRSLRDLGRVRPLRGAPTR
jgi:uncharacterized membrane protein YbhN (UPF0104 family)